MHNERQVSNELVKKKSDLHAKLKFENEERRNCGKKGKNSNFRKKILLFFQTPLLRPGSSNH